jgi:hypothetical protein
MSSDDLKKALKVAQSQLAGALHHRDKWTMEVARLQQLVKSLAVAFPADKGTAKIAQEADIIGIQELVFSCVRTSPGVTSAKDIKLQLDAIAYNFERFANPLAVIHGALKRLHDQGKILKAGLGYKRDPFHELRAKEGFPAD